MILLGASLFLRSTDEPADIQHGALPETIDRLDRVPLVARVDAGPRPLPASLWGVQEDGALVVDADGRFRATPDAIDLFDYYLAAIGEESEAQIRERIVAVIHARLDGEAADAAIALLDDYFAYRLRAANELDGRLAGVDLERRLQYIRELRRDVFGPATASALFEAEEAQWFADLERRRLLQDDVLDPSERDRRLADLDASLPDAQRTIRDAPRAHRLLRDEEERLRAKGADASEIDRLREERFGQESATRLAALDASRLDWQARLRTYRVERDRLVLETDSEDLAARIQALRARHFEGGELIRIRALEQIDARETQ